MNKGIVEQSGIYKTSNDPPTLDNRLHHWPEILSLAASDTAEPRLNPQLPKLPDTNAEQSSTILLVPCIPSVQLVMQRTACQMKTPRWVAGPRMADATSMVSGHTLRRCLVGY
jgi:hypothetical protein